MASGFQLSLFLNRLGHFVPSKMWVQTMPVKKVTKHRRTVVSG